MKTKEQLRHIIEECDFELARLFERRMKACSEIGHIKKEAGLPVWDPVREQQLLDGTEALLKEHPEWLLYFREVRKTLMKVSRELQEQEQDHLYVRGNPGYPIEFEEGLLARLGEFIHGYKRLLLVTDEGVPRAYVDVIQKQFDGILEVTLPAGETTKSLASFEALQKILLAKGFSREDALIALGGGMICDLTGFVASTFKRGIDCYLVPTTLLSQVDASVGGKTAINFLGFKNEVGTFREPKAVFIDPLVLRTLPQEQLASGMAELLKMAALFDEELFCEIEASDGKEILDSWIRRAIELKIQIVEEDELEQGVRMLLNFGHTVGHAIEAHSKGYLLHGQCVALGMLWCSSPEVRSRLEKVLLKYGIGTQQPYSLEELKPYILKDKKHDGDGLSYVYLPALGTPELRHATDEDFLEFISEEMHT